MSLRKPSERRHNKEIITNLDLIPVMNLVCLLIPCLLIQMAMIEIAVINVSSPFINNKSNKTLKATKHSPDLNLTLTISDKGIYVTSSVNNLFTDKKDIKAKKDSSPTINKANGKYDYISLKNILNIIKDQYPEESKVIMMAEPDIPFDIIIEVMDLARGTKDERLLFPDVILSAGLA